MSVRSRIAQFESLTREGDSNKNKTIETSTEKRKRFHHPGSIKKTQEPEQPVMGMGPPRVKLSGVPDIEADLQEVWSVRRNIHHTGKSKSATSVTLPTLTTTAGKYSRHGAIPAHQSQGPVPQTVPGGHLLHIVTSKEGFMNKDMPTGTMPFPSPHPAPYYSACGRRSSRTRPGLTTRRDDYPLDTRQMPLQEYNFQSSPWNIRTGHYTYSEGSPAKERERLSPGVSPTAKRKPNLNVGSIRATHDVGGVRPTYDVGGVRPTYDVGSVRPTYDVGSVRPTYDVGGVRPTYDEKIHSFPPKRSNKDENERVSYAKRMARGYLRSVGVGEYTPRRSGYSKESENQDGNPTKWKKLDYHDEFDF